MARWVWVTAGATVLVTAAVSVGVFLAAPEPITGDVEADAACAELASVALTDTRSASTELGLMSRDERREWVRGIVDHSSQSTIPTIREAGQGLAVAQMMDGSFYYDKVFMIKMLQMAEHCNAAGWDVRKAGLYSE